MHAPDQTLGFFLPSLCGHLQTRPRFDLYLYHHPGLGRTTAGHNTATAVGARPAGAGTGASPSPLPALAPEKPTGGCRNLRQRLRQRRGSGLLYLCRSRRCCPRGVVVTRDSLS